MGNAKVIAIDTHVWIYLTAGKTNALSKDALAALDKAETVLLNAISCWETALLVEKGRLELDRDVRLWILQALKYPKLEIINLDPLILIEAVQLKDFHPDPADRMIAAMCLVRDIPLVTKDHRIQEWGRIKTIW